MSDPNESSSSKKPVEDGANERLVLDQQPTAHHSQDDRVELKFVPEPKNGAPRPANIRVAFVGMGKEELMKYANNPYWVKMRWSLFIMFWVLWFAMLAGAIAIIILAPKCAINQDSALVENPIIYEIDIGKSDSQGSSLTVLNDHVLSMKDSGVDLIVVNTLMKTASDGDVIDFTEVDPSYGSRQDVKNWLKKMKDQGIKIVMSFVPNYSSEEHQWFKDSTIQDEPFVDYYVWTKGPVNNWKTVDDNQSESAWALDDIRKEYYLHQFKKNQPDFNFRNSEVVGNFTEIIKFWMDLGFYGLHLDKAEFLVEDKDFKDEPIINNPSSLTPSSDYRMLNHLYTTNLPETIAIVDKWATMVIEKMKGFLSTSHLKDTTKPSINRSPVIDIGYNKEPTKKLLVEELYRLVSSRLNHSKVTWEWNVVCSDTSGDECSSIRTALDVFSILLPGSPIIKESLSDVSLNNTENTFPSKFKELLLQRKSLVKEKVKINHLNDTILSYSRTKDSHSGFTAFINLGPSAAINVLNNPDSSKNYTVAAISQQNDNFSTGQTLNPPLEIPPLTTLVLSYRIKTSS